MKKPTYILTLDQSKDAFGDLIPELSKSAKEIEDAEERKNAETIVMCVVVGASLLFSLVESLERISKK